MLTRPAPAKVNLTLEVLARRADGYHEIRSLMQALSLADRLHFSASETVKISSDDPGWDASRSLVSRAVALMQGTAPDAGGVEIKVEKRIPLMAGLGGDSSDAAAVLLGLNTLWDLKLPLGRLYPLALLLGSDVPFFLTGGTMLARGRGENLTPLKPLPPISLVLLLPQMESLEGKTARAYAAIGEDDFTQGEYTYRAVSEINRGHGFDPEHGFNVFDNVVPTVYTGLEAAVRDFAEAGAERIHLAGAGPTLYAVTPDAAAVCDRLVESGYQALVTEAVAGFGGNDTLFYNDVN